MMLTSRWMILPALALLGACAPRPAPQQLVDPYAGLQRPAPAPAALPTAADFRTEATDTVRFPSEATALDGAAREALAGQADWLMQHPGFTALIEGHAAETEGTRAYAASLAARRAGAVQEYLIASGVAPLRLRTVSFGKERPLAPCSSEECYAQNRRARTVVSPGAGS